MAYRAQRRAVSCLYLLGPWPNTNYVVRAVSNSIATCALQHVIIAVEAQVRRWARRMLNHPRRWVQRGAD